MIDDLIRTGKFGNPKVLQDLLNQEHELLHGLEHSQGHDKHHQYEQSLRYVRSQLREKKTKYAAEFHEQYGHELQRLSSVYIEIEDFNDVGIFLASSEEIDDLQLLIASLEEDAEKFFTPEMTKKIALMHDHINFLLKYETDPELRKKLESLDDRLQKLLDSAMNLANDDMKDGNEAAGHSSISLPMTDEDVRDLHFLLEFESKLGKTQWRLLFLYLKKSLVKIAKKVMRKT